MKLRERFVLHKRKIMCALAPVGVMAAMSVPAFAEEVSGGNALDSVVVTTDMLTPIVDAVTANVRVILPVGLVIFGILLGIGLIRGILKKFAPGGSN